MLAIETGTILRERILAGATLAAIEQSVFIAIVFLLVYGNLIYQMSRLGHVWRRQCHRTAARGTIETRYLRSDPAPLTVLVPAYCEEPRVVMQTLMSAALMEYPRLRVTLLIDDPPRPGDRDAASSLAAMRRLPELVAERLRPQCIRFEAALRAFEARRGAGSFDIRAEAGLLADLYGAAAGWLEDQAACWEVRDHGERFFVDRILRGPARDHRRSCRRLRAIAATGEGRFDELDALAHHRRLAGLFRVSLTGFERKLFGNLSHEPNKAMNLNSYIGLIGHRFHTVRRDGGEWLVACGPDEDADLIVPEAEYLMTLDADSMVLSDYALRLVGLLEQPDHADVAVVQTPYSAYPGAPGAIERIAGATTDIQHIVHQGFTAYGATYWVGANALLRRDALEDICETVDPERPLVRRFISDRTVIEDTESSVDLIRCGWRLLNYPSRLAFSATPPDFGALLIQRRRWANGGLLIVPRLMGYLRAFWWRPAIMGEVFVRCHYLISLSTVSLGVLLLLLYPFEDAMRSLWLPLTALPYFLLYGRDLVQAGYRWSDLPRVYALNLMLIPVHLGGVLASLRQALTGRKSPFGRTPKVSDRTGAPPVYHAVIHAIIIYCAIGSAIDMEAGRWAHGLFALINAGFFGYAALVYIGLGEAWEDAMAWWRERPDLRPRPPGPAAPVLRGNTETVAWRPGPLVPERGGHGD